MARHRWILILLGAALLGGLVFWVREAPQLPDDGETPTVVPGEAGSPEGASQLDPSRVLIDPEDLPSTDPDPASVAELSIRLRNRAGQPVAGASARAFAVDQSVAAVDPIDERGSSDRTGVIRFTLPAPGRYRYELLTHQADAMSPPHEEISGRDPSIVFDRPMPSGAPPNRSGVLELKAGERREIELIVDPPTRVMGRLPLTAGLDDPAEVLLQARGKYSMGPASGPAAVQENRSEVHSPGVFSILCLPGEKALTASWWRDDELSVVTRTFRIEAGQTLDLGVLLPAADSVLSISARFSLDGADSSARDVIGTDVPRWRLNLNAVGVRDPAEPGVLRMETSGMDWTVTGLSSGEWLVGLELLDFRALPGVAVESRARAEAVLPGEQAVILSFPAMHPIPVSVDVLAAPRDSQVTLQIFLVDRDRGTVIKKKGVPGRHPFQVVPGRYRAVATSYRFAQVDPANLAAEADLVISPDQSLRRVELTLAPAVTREGTIWREGRPDSGRTVSFTLSELESAQEGLFIARSDPRGRLRVTGIPPSRHLVPVGRHEVRWD